MPNIGEIRKGREIGKNGYDAGLNYIWRSCIDCGREEWAASRREQPTRLRCKACKGKQVWKTRHTREATHPKGTITQPYIGDIRRADDIGFHSNRPSQWCIFVQCPICQQTRWILKSNYHSSLQKGTNGLCKNCSGHRLGENINNWRGGICHSQGYLMVMVRPDNPFYPMVHKSANRGQGGYVYEHRLVIAQHLGRCLYDWEVVHHKNHIRDDNRFENLELLPRSQHEGLVQLENRITNLEQEMGKQTQIIRLLLWHIAELNSTRRVV